MDEPDPTAPASRSASPGRPPCDATAAQPAPSRDTPFASFDQVVRAYWTPLHDRLLRIEHRLTEVNITPAPAFPTTAFIAPPDSRLFEQLGDDARPPMTIHDLSDELNQATLQLRQRLDALRDELRDELLALRQSRAESPMTAPAGRPAAEARSAPTIAPAAPASLSSSNNAWEVAILGAELCGPTELAAQRHHLLHDLHAGHAAAQSLAGQLLLLHASSAEELPERLRHVGEAYYRWRPRTNTADDPLESALAAIVTGRAEGAGLRNSIQLVRPGDRFDSSRHVTNGRGLEVVAVHGWIVLRENHKVYTKASVSVR